LIVSWKSTGRVSLTRLWSDDQLAKKVVNTIPHRDWRKTMTGWANYDIDGKRVAPSSKRAAFRANEVIPWPDQGTPFVTLCASAKCKQLPGRAC
jgi:hypothetical protein